MAIGLVSLLIGAAAGGATYLYVKNKKQAETGTAAVAGGVVGAGATAGAVVISGLVAALWLPALVIGVPAALAYYVGKNRASPKALPPGRD